MQLVAVPISRFQGDLTAMERERERKRERERERWKLIVDATPQTNKSYQANILYLLNRQFYGFMTVCR